MTQRVPIRMNVANALQWLGTLYRNPADAIKEHVSNAIDEHLKAQAAIGAKACCTVTFRLEKRQVEIAYPYGMTREEFQGALQRVADSAKRRSKVVQIGQLGIGIFGFQQIGRKCTFFSRKDLSSPTIRVTLREGWDKAEFDAARKHESLDSPGIRILISELKFDPTKPRGPLAAEKLARLITDKFGSHLSSGRLAAEVWVGAHLHVVQAPSIDLPRIGRGLEHIRIAGPRDHVARLLFFFDPSGKAVVSVRHVGVVVVEDLKLVNAYGLEDSVYTSGYVRGFIDADFLRPLPARTGFDENEDWVALLSLLDRHRPQIEAEVEQLRTEEREKELSGIQRQAVQLAREILDLEDFRDLELPGGLAKAHAVTGNGRAEPAGRQTAERSQQPGDHPDPRGPRIRYSELAFQEGARRHSRYVAGVVEANTLNSDYQREVAGGTESKLAYATLVIGKEAIGFNDKSGASEEQLEKLLTFHFTLKRRIGRNGRSEKRPARERAK